VSNKPLAGIRILDLTRLLPGPMCGLHLADMGADVIKIEDPGAGDYSRHRKAGDKAGLAPIFDQINRNKRSLKLDLKQAEGVQAFMDLVAQSHVVIEGFRPGVMTRLRVRAHNPGIVFCAISGYGQDGPLRDVAGHDINYCGYAGVLHQSGSRGGPPAIPNLQIADLLGGALSAAMGILAALVDAQRSGEGRYVDVAMTDCTLAHNVVPFARAKLDGEARPRGQDALNGGLPCYGEILAGFLRGRGAPGLDRTPHGKRRNGGPCARGGCGDFPRREPRQMGGTLIQRGLLRLTGAVTGRGAPPPAAGGTRHVRHAR